MSDEQRRRLAMLAEVEAEFGPGGWLRPPRPLPRWVAVASRNEGRSHGLTVHDDEASAVRELTEGLGSWYPVGVVDLDDGSMADASVVVELDERVGMFEVEDDESDDACADDPDGVHHVGCGCE